MALILNIDTALDTASLSLAQEGRLLQSSTNERQGDHAAWIHPAIQKLMQISRLSLGDLNAVGISIGPGSYTGLRIGLATAKGLCYSLKIPLITVGTLEALALSAIKNLETSAFDSRTHDSRPAYRTGRLTTHDLLFCPMIDARRMEVFTAVYDSNLNEVVNPHAIALNEQSFEELLKGRKILFLGNGSIKFKNLCQNAHAMFKNIGLNPVALAILTYRNFIGNNFAALAYEEPLYLKEFFTKENEPLRKGHDRS
jgi:tRNA threonylcarbamoyladenosine biosynthesis protein TsaB